jgi:hypothetical protein
VLIADVADNPGGGGRGNTAYVLRGFHEASIAGVVLAKFVDPDLAAEAHGLGEGARFTAPFNRNPSEFSAPFSAPARIVKLSDGRGIGRRGTMAGRAFDLGPAALLELEGSGIRVVVASLRRQCHEPRMMEMFGVDIAAARVVVVKSRGHFRAGFDEFFPDERILEVDVPGLTSPVLVNFHWKRLWVRNHQGVLIAGQRQTHAGEFLGRLHPTKVQHWFDTGVFDSSQYRLVAHKRDQLKALLNQQLNLGKTTSLNIRPEQLNVLLPKCCHHQIGSL